MAGQRAHQRSVLPSGRRSASTGQGRFPRGGHPRADPAASGGRRVALAVASSGGPALADEDHVYVAGVVELAAAALAHPDHGQADAGTSVALNFPPPPPGIPPRQLQ